MTAAPAAPDAPIASSPKPTVLLVDDDGVRLALRAILKREGYDVTDASGVAGARPVLPGAASDVTFVRIVG